jgi:hypothetical protein
MSLLEGMRKGNCLLDKKIILRGSKLFAWIKTLRSFPLFIFDLISNLFSFLIFGSSDFFVAKDDRFWDAQKRIESGPLHRCRARLEKYF